MPFLSLEQADVLLRPFYDNFEQIVRSSWKDWRSSTVAPQMQHKRVRANYVWNQLIANAKRQFDGCDAVRVETIRNWDGVLVQDSIFIRMKKGTDRLLSRNYPTQAAMAFHDQIQDLFGGIARLELLYILNSAETDIERIVLIQRHKKHVTWVIDLLKPATEMNNVLPLIPQDPAPQAGSVADRLIKPKDTQTDKKQYGTTGDDS
jgi:hypothetical protein